VGAVAGGDFQRIVGADGTITYTNMPFGQFNTVARDGSAYSPPCGTGRAA